MKQELIPRRVRGLLLITFVILAIFYFLPSKPSQHQECVLVTGGLGFIGSNLVDELIKLGYKVVVFDDGSTGNTYNEEAINILGDITKPKDFNSITHKVDYVIHFAAAISVSESMTNPEKYNKINVLGSKTVLEWAAKHEVKKVVSASSAAIYGTPLELPLSEDSRQNPISPYAETKQKMEQLHKAFQQVYDMDCICLRFFNVYGPRQHPKSPYSGVISKFIDSATTGGDITIFGDGRNTRDFVYVKDVAQANINALKYGKGFQVFNVGTETVTTITQLAETLIKITGSSSKIVYADAKEGDIKDSLSNTTNIRSHLHWQPTVSLEEGLKRTVEWYKESLRNKN